ncbi:testis-expressed protein 10 homolog [Ciona intestinalis]
MGKTSRKTKAKKKDFNKVKLKVGKKKPAAENATDTAFKSQSIYIPDQLKSQENISVELLTHRKQSVEDLLSHLNHFSPTFRYQALNGLKEIFSNHGNKGTINASKICERVIRSVTDVDSEVRKACTSLLWHIFSTVPEQQMSPKFPLILSHLYCAMSHISKDVQQSSLKVVDLCFQFYPNLVCSEENRPTLLQHFIELISSKQGEKSANSRILTMNLSKKESAISWRIKVLKRLWVLLKRESVKEEIKQVDFGDHVCWDSDEIGLHLVPNVKRQHGVLLRNLEASSLVKVHQQSTMQTISTVLPLLFQCWLEVSATGILTKDEETVTTMTLVMNITLELCKSFQTNQDGVASQKLREWIHQNYLTSFKKYFFTNFPFEQWEAVSLMPKKKKKQASKPDVDLLGVNLAICELAALYPPEPIQNDENSSPSLDYITQLLQNAADSRNMETRVLKQILTCMDCILTKNSTQDFGNEISSCLHHYTDTLPKCHVHRTLIVEFLIEHSGNTDGLDSGSLLSSLPTQLVDILRNIASHKESGCKLQSDASTILHSTMRCIKCLLRRKHPGILPNLQEKFLTLILTITKSSAKLFCQNGICKTCKQFQREIVQSCIPYLQDINEGITSGLFHFCFSEFVCQENICYVIDVLAQRLDSSCHDQTLRTNSEKVGLLQFLLCSVIGCKKDDLCPKNKEIKLVPEEWKIVKHEIVSMHATIMLFKLCSSDNNVVSIVRSFLSSSVFTTKPQSLNTVTWVGLFKLGIVFSPTNCLTGLENKFGHLASHCLVRCLNNVNACERIVETCIDLLCNSDSIFRCCLLNLFEHSSSVSCITELLQIPKLHKSFQQVISLISDYIDSLEATECDQKELQRLKLTASSLNLFQNKSNFQRSNKT